MSKDYYKTLGVSKDASDTEIKKAYRKLALQYHPDKHKGDNDAEKKFKEINEAYQVLSDQQKRVHYDQFGNADHSGGFPGSASGFQGGFDFSDIFESFFGASGGRSGRQKRGPMTGNDIEVSMNLSFEEAAFGCQKDLEITKPVQCSHCKGNGAEPGSKIINCINCNGSGQIRSVKNTILGQIATNSICDNCLGEGRIPERKCTKCHGSTRLRDKEQVRVKIPRGIDNGSTIRLSEKGEGGVYGGGNGDLYVHVQVLPSTKYIRSGYDVHGEKELHIVQAVLGDEVDIETIHGKVKIKVPSGTQSGRVFKIKGKGVQKLHSGTFGDHYVKIRVNIPEKLLKKDRELWIELAKNSGLDPKGIREGFLKGLFFD